MSTQRRRPTGKPAWPHILVAGPNQSGKTWIGVQASSFDDIVGHTDYITFGERSADEYAQMPGSNFELLEPENRRELREVVRDAVALPRVDERPNLIVLDSATPLWDLLCGEVNAAGGKRAADKAARQNRTVDPDDVDKTPDLWNTAKERWNAIMDPLFRFDGLVIITARLEDQIEMNGGKPTGRRVWKVAGHKSLPYSVDVNLQMRGQWGPRQNRAVLGVKSYAWQQPDAAEEAVDAKFGVREILDRMGVSLETVGPRHVSVAVSMPDGTTREETRPAPNEGAAELWQTIVTAALNLPNPASAKAKLTVLWRDTQEGTDRRAVVDVAVKEWSKRQQLRALEEVPPVEPYVEPPPPERTLTGTPQEQDKQMHQNQRDAVTSWAADRGMLPGDGQDSAPADPAADASAPVVDDPIGQDQADVTPYEAPQQLDPEALRDAARMTTKLDRAMADNSMERVAAIFHQAVAKGYDSVHDRAMKFLDEAEAAAKQADEAEARR